MTATHVPHPSESTIIGLLAAVQFVNILDFMMVMPLGPDFAKALAIPESNLGLIGGSYTAAAAVSGVAGTFFLDRFDRRRALAMAMLGLVIATACGALATGLGTLMVARVLAGMFGGPATSLSFSIVADIVAPARLGKAMGTLMASFSLASVLGVPAGLELARHFGWRAPFLAVAGLGLVVGVGATRLMPPLSPNPPRATETKPIGELLGRPMVIFILAAAFLYMSSTFVLVPALSAYIQYNLGYPRDRIGLLYLVGGGVSFLAMFVIGPLVDRMGAVFVTAVGSLMMIGVIALGFVSPSLPTLLLFVGFMLAQAFRTVSFGAMSSRVPLANERAGFASMQSAVQHVAGAMGAFLSAKLLTELPNRNLVGMWKTAAVSIGLGLFVPIMIWRVDVSLRQRDAAL